jgi:hypothetical protein
MMLIRDKIVVAIFATKGAAAFHDVPKEHQSVRRKKTGRNTRFVKHYGPRRIQFETRCPALRKSTEHQVPNLDKIEIGGSTLPPAQSIRRVRKKQCTSRRIGSPAPRISTKMLGYLAALRLI